MRRHLLLSLVVGAVLASAASSALAEGPGIKLGEALVLHPGIGLILGFDDNVQYAAHDQPKARAFYGSAHGVLDLSTLSLQRGGDTPHTLDFRLHAGLTYRYLFPLFSDPTARSNYSQQHNSLDVDASTLLTLLPFGKTSADVFDNFVHSDVPPYFISTQPGNLKIDSNQLGLRLRLRPGGGRIEAMLTYTFGWYAFESDPTSIAYSDKNYLSHDFQLRVQWKFFPKTALYLNAQETIYSYYNRDKLSDGSTSPALVGRTPPNSFPLRIVLGIVGLVTPTLSVNLNVGYANGFYSTTICASLGSNMVTPALAAACAASPQTVAATIEGRWRPTLVTEVALGYHHDFNVSLIGSYYDLDQFYLGLSQQIWRIIASARSAWEHRSFQGNLEADGQALGRTDDLITLHVDLNLPIRDWIGLTLAYDGQYNLSNCQPLATQPSALACDYVRDDFWLRLLVKY